MNTAYVDVIDDILATGANPVACNADSFEFDILDNSVVKASVLGEELDVVELELLTSIMDIRHLSRGERLVTEGDTDNRLVLVAAGRVAVLCNIDGHEVRVHTMTRGECAGTRAFVDGTPRKATLDAIDNATVYTLTPEALEAVVELHPTTAYKVMRGLFKATHSNLIRVREERQQLTNYITQTGGRY